MKFIKYLIVNVLFLTLLLTIYVAHIYFFKVNVLFYSSLFDGVLAAVLILLLINTIKYFEIFTRFERFQLVISLFLLGYIFAISVPTVIDRSLSFYTLEKLQQRGGGIKLEAFEDVFTKEYVKEHRLIDVRLTEQLQSGTIVLRGACVMLTERGERIATLSRFFRAHFLPKERLLMGEYSDSLTDPFRNSSAAVDYQCR